jgi:cytochrome P450/NADPH-cytochrome P450 reductase
VTIKPALRLFHPPKDPETTPIIMGCAGTGLAPFLAFLEERSIQAKSGLKLAPAHLFIGCRHPERDALLKKELTQWETNGIVKVFYAFSQAREVSDGCKHVQDRIWNERGLVKRGMLEANSVFYVCGGHGVGKSIEEVMKRIYRDINGEEKKKEADDWFQGLKSNRYITEIFS